MTVEEFKNAYPEKRHLEGQELWDEMQNTMYRHQEADAITVTITKPLCFRYTLRWLFYRVIPNLTFSTEFSAETRCSHCKTGVGSFVYWEGAKLCMHCSQVLYEEDNVNFSHYKYKLYKWIGGIFWGTLDWLHIVRSSHSSRYDIFGDEHYFVKKIRMQHHKPIEFILRPRKWWEYIIIRKPIR